MSCRRQGARFGRSYLLSRQRHDGGRQRGPLSSTCRASVAHSADWVYVSTCLLLIWRGKRSRWARRLAPTRPAAGSLVWVSNLWWARMRSAPSRLAGMPVGMASAVSVTNLNVGLSASGGAPQADHRDLTRAAGVLAVRGRDRDRMRPEPRPLRSRGPRCDGLIALAADLDGHLGVRQ